MEKTFILIRHGMTEMNNTKDTSVDRIRGWLDVPLSVEGLKEAHKLGLELQDMGLDVLYSSDLERAQETADIIAKKLKIKVRYTGLLRPWDLGTFAGESTKESLPAIAEYVEKKPDIRVPEGESFNSFKKRVFLGLKEIVDSGKDIGVVTHHRVERLLKAWVKKGCPVDHSIDLSTFLQKGENPGNWEEVTIEL
jgi:broad specificity phosphatase PhoE